MGLLGDPFTRRFGAGNLDHARLESVRHFAHEADVQKAVLKAGAGGAHMVGKLELAVKGTGGDATVQIGRGVAL